MWGEEGTRYFCELVESTQAEAIEGSPVVGVQVTQLSQRVASYQGDMWWCPMRSDARERMDATAGFNWLYAQIGKPYDLAAAVQAGVDFADRIPWLGAFSQAEEDFSALFCSELAAGFLEAAGVVVDVNASEVTPIDLVRWAVWEPAVQLKGNPTRIPGYGKLEPNGWPERA
jgi:hypothetical protein